MCTSISEKGQRITAQLLLYSLQLLPQETHKCDKPTGGLYYAHNVLLSIIMQSASVSLYVFICSLLLHSPLIVGNTPHHGAEAWQYRHMLPNNLLRYVPSKHPSRSRILKW